MDMPTVATKKPARSAANKRATTASKIVKGRNHLEGAIKRGHRDYAVAGLGISADSPMHKHASAIGCVSIELPKTTEARRELIRARIHADNHS
jgi:hypothetical protein